MWWRSEYGDPDAEIFFVFQAENILLVELDMPNRTTRDYEGPAVAPKIQAALDAALMDEDDIDLDANDIKYRTHCKRCEVTL